MRNPQRSRNIALVTLLCAVCAMAAGFAMPDAAPGFTPQFALRAGGFMVAMFAAVVALIRVGDARRFARMARGEGVIARWTVDPRSWRAFVEMSRAMDRQENAEGNRLDLTREPPDLGVEVVVGDNAICVGGDFHSLAKNATVSIHPSWMEFRELVAGGETQTVAVVVRFPMAPGAEHHAQRIQDHYHSVYDEAEKQGGHFKKYLLFGCLAIILLSPLIAFLPGVTGNAPDEMQGFDANHDGALSDDELGSYFRERRAGDADSHREKDLRDFDLNRDGRIDDAEETAQRDTISKRVQKAREEFDSDGNGTLEEKEHRRLIDSGWNPFDTDSDKG